MWQSNQEFVLIYYFFKGKWSQGDIYGLYEAVVFFLLLLTRTTGNSVRKAPVISQFCKLFSAFYS